MQEPPNRPGASPPQAAHRVTSVAWDKWVFAAGLALVLAAQLPATAGDFFSDDYVYIQGNEALGRVELSEPWRFFTERTNPYEYLPVRDLSYRIDVALFGDKPMGYHLHNLALYGLCCGALWLLLGALLAGAAQVGSAPATGPGAAPPPEIDGGEAATSGWRATRLATALLFAAHPAHVESVAWISGRKELLSGLFALTALWLWLRAVQAARISWPRLLAACALFGLALLSKASVLPLPAVALAMALVAPGPKHRTPGLVARLRRPLLAALPLFALAALATWGHLQQAAEARLVPGATAAGGGLLAHPDTTLAILGTLGHISLLPIRLRLIYDVQAPGAGQTAAMALGVAALIAGMAGAVLAWRRRDMSGMAAWTFLAFCLPFLQILPFGTWSLASERFVFLPLLGVALGLALAARRLRPGWWLPVVAALTLTLTGMSAARSVQWGDRAELLRSNAENAPGSFVAWQRYLAYVLLPAGQYAEAAAGAAGVSDLPGRALLLSWVQVAQAVSKGEPESARAQAQQLARLVEGRQLPLVELALADWHEQVGEPLEAARRFHQVAHTAFTGALAARARQGLARVQAGFSARLQALERAADGAPDDPGPHGTLGNLQLQLYLLEQAEARFERVLALAPGHPTALYNLGLTRARMGRHAQAAATLRQAIDAGMGRAVAWNNLGIALGKAGDPQAAQRAYERALALDPAHWHAAWNLARLLAERGDLSGARAAVDRALGRMGDRPGERALLEMLSAGLRRP